MNQNNRHLNKPVIIAIVIFVSLFTILTIVAIFAQSNTARTQKEAAGKEVIDPVSGETITQDSGLTHTGAGSPNSDRPTMLGFGKLLDYGVSADQSQEVKTKLTEFAKAQDPKITHMSFYKDSYIQQLPDENGIAHMTFMIQANKKTDYYVDIAYSGTSEAKLSVYEKDKTTLLFAQ